MKKHLLEELNANEIARGMKLCQLNASELYDDAEILLAANRLPRAYTLYQLAIEEIGKIRILSSLFYSLKIKEKIDYKKINKNFLSHQPKARESIGFEQIPVMLMYNGAKEEIEKENLKQYFKELLDEKNKTEIFNSYKNFSLYVSIYNGVFVTPKDMITIDRINNIRTSALIRLKSLSNLIQTLTDEPVILKAEEIVNNPDYEFNDDYIELFKD